MLEIEVGNINGPHFNLAKFTRLRTLAFAIGRAQPTATNFKLWYDADKDYHRLSFELDGHYYELRYYKVFRLTKDRRTHFLLEKGFHIYDHHVVEFFEYGKHERWDVTVGIYDVWLDNILSTTVCAHSMEEARAMIEGKVENVYFTIICALEPCRETR